MTMEVPKKYLSSAEYLHDQWRLAAAVRRSGWRPDWLVGLWRGGAPAAIAVHEFLKVAGWSVRHMPLKCASYDGIGSNHGDVMFAFGDEMFGLFQRGERVLFVDDVFDTGKTAAAVHARMSSTGAEMKLACVYWKPGKNTTSILPDFYAKDIGDDWIVFPHEIEGLSPDEVREKSPLLAELLTAELAVSAAEIGPSPMPDER